MLIRNLIFLYHVITASERLLIAAADMACTENLRDYFKHHLAEERGHASWLADDLASVGIDVTKTKAPSVAREMVGSVYYLIFHADAAALLGYMRVLEGWPMDKKRLQELGRQYPASLLRTTFYHADHDPGHFADLLRVIDGLTQERKALVDQVSELTNEYMRRAMDEFISQEIAA